MTKTKPLDTPSTIAASYLIGIGVFSCDNRIIRRGSMPCDIINDFCLSLPMTTFFKHTNDSTILLWSLSSYRSSIYERELSTSCKQKKKNGIERKRRSELNVISWVSINSLHTKTVLGFVVRVSVRTESQMHDHIHTSWMTQTKQKSRYIIEVNKAQLYVNWYSHFVVYKKKVISSIELPIFSDDCRH